MLVLISIMLPFRIYTELEREDGGQTSLGKLFANIKRFVLFQLQKGFGWDRGKDLELNRGS